MFRRPLAAALFALLPLAVQATPRIEQVYPALAAANATERAILFTGDDRQAIDTFFRKHGSYGTEQKQLPRREPLLVRDRLPEKAAVYPLPPTLDSQLPSPAQRLRPRDRGTRRRAARPPLANHPRHHPRSGPVRTLFAGRLTL